MSPDPATAALASATIAFSPDDASLLDEAVDRLLDALGGDRVRLLGVGEPTHGVEEPLALRNAWFRRLVDRHGFTGIAIESSFPRGRLADDYVHGRVAGPFAAVREAAFSHGFGKPSTTRELLDWMREHNAHAPADRRLNFYGFDGPMEMMYTDAPRQSVGQALAALAKLDPAAADALRARIEPLLGDDADWANAQANMDPSRSVGDSPTARALRAEVDQLVVAATAARGPESGQPVATEHLDAQHLAAAAARLLAYHHAVATLPADRRLAGLLSMRDAIMGDHLAYASAREGRRGGRLLAFAHNSHLQRGTARWQWGPTLIEWRPAGSHAAERLGDAYAVIATAAGAAPSVGLPPAQPGTLEAALCAAPGPIRAVLTRDLRAAARAYAPRPPNPRFFPLTPQHLTDFDAIVTFDVAAAQRVDG